MATFTDRNIYINYIIMYFMDKSEKMALCSKPIFSRFADIKFCGLPYYRLLHRLLNGIYLTIRLRAQDL